MARDIVTNLIANDKASRPLKDAGDAATKTARNYDDLSAAEQRLALAAEKAGAAVEKAAKAAANAEQRFGKESEQARLATRRLREAKLDLADAEEKVAAKARAAGDAADDATKQVHQLADAADRADESVGRSSGALGALGGVIGRVVPTLGRGVAGLAGFGTVALTAAPAVLALGVKVAALGAKVVQFGGAVAPAAASLLPLAAGLALIKGTLIATGPAFKSSLSPITQAFIDVQKPVGALATNGLPALAREFVRVNFPAIRTGMENIARSVNGIVVSVGRWINSTTGQQAIAKTVGNISEAFAKLAPDVSKLALSFLNLFGRTAGDTRAIDLLTAGLQRALGAATNFIDGLTPAKIDAAWAAIGRFAGSVQDFAGRVAGWGAAIMGAVRWWKAHAEEIQHVRDVLGVVAIAVGVATGGWLPALAAGVSLLVAHWDKVSAAMSAAKRWLGGTSEEATAARGVIDALSGAVGDLSSWFTSKLLPALQRAGEAILPTLQDAVGQVSRTFNENRAVIGKAEGVLAALGVVLTEAVIPALTWVYQHVLPVLTDQFNGMVTIVNRLVLPAMRGLMNVTLDAFGAIINGAADTFGWVPGLGPQLKTAAGKFNTFRDQVNAALSGIKDQKVTVGATIYYGDGTVGFKGSTVKAKKDGGHITGPGGPRDDRVPALLSNGEFVVNARDTARHRPLLESINAGRYANGGLVVGASTSGLAETMAAQRRGLLAAAKRLMPDLMASVGSVGAGVQRWAPLVMQVLRMLGQPAGALGPVLSRMRRESGGNPRAINLTDINARRGDPSIGLMQTIGATFRAYAGPFRGRGIYDPLANIYAGINYATHRYGGNWIRRMTMPGGYDRGGLARGAGFMPKYTSAPERVLSPAQTNRFERAMSAAGGATHVTVSISAPNYIGSQADLRQTLVQFAQTGQLDVVLKRAGVKT